MASEATKAELSDAVDTMIEEVSWIIRNALFNLWPLNLVALGWKKHLLWYQCSYKVQTSLGCDSHDV